MPCRRYEFDSRWALGWVEQGAHSRLIACWQASRLLAAHQNSLRREGATRASEARRSGAIPGRSAVARSGVGFQRLIVTEFIAGSIPASHPGSKRWQVPLGRELDCLSSRCGFDSRCHRFFNAASDDWLVRLSLEQPKRDRNSETVLWLSPNRQTLKVLWSNGNDACLTNRKRWFDSIQDYW